MITSTPSQAKTLKSQKIPLKSLKTILKKSSFRRILVYSSQKTFYLYSDGGSKSAGEEASKKKTFSNWMNAIAIVKFDIDQGNVLEAIYPEDILSTPERRTLSFLAFPDSNSFSAEGALKYVFRFQKGKIQKVKYRW